MKLRHDLHLAYCTNIHRGETWPETMDALARHTLAVREQVCPREPFAIGLRLSDQASRELSQPAALKKFQRWLERNHCYVFTINGFPYGAFHGQRVKERVYLPDWTNPDRVNYTNRLFDLLGALLPEGMEGSVSTVPGSFKEFITSDAQVLRIQENIFQSVLHIAEVSAQTGRRLHLGLEPEPLGLIENTDETIRFFERLGQAHPKDSRLEEFLGITYDSCHFAVEFEEPAESLKKLRQHGIQISKLHLSSALKTRPGAEALDWLSSFAEGTYLHQVIARGSDGKLTRLRDLDVALTAPKSSADEWRIHFHVPLHSRPVNWFDNTTDHLVGVLDCLKENPRLCSHLEMETYTWEVLPGKLKSRSVVEQLTAEYEWCLAALRERGLA